MRTRATKVPWRDAPHSWLTLGALMVVLWIVAGCIRPPKPTPRPIPEEPASAATVIERYNANADRMPSDVLFSSRLSAEAGFIDEDDQIHHFDGDGRLLLVKPTYLHLEIRHGLGGNMLEIGADGKRYWLYYRQSKKVWWGKFEHLDRAEARDMLIRPDRVIAALGLTQLPVGSGRLFGPCFLVPNRPIPHTLHPQYALSYYWRPEGQTPRLEREYGISRASPFLAERIVFGDKHGRIGCVATLAHLGPVGVRKEVIEGPAPIMPHQIYLRLAKEQNYLSLKLNRPTLREIPPGLRPPNWKPMPYADSKPPADWEIIQIDEAYDREPGR